MAVYLGFMGENSSVKAGRIVGGSVEVLCNSLKALDGKIDLPVKYNIDPSYFRLVGCAPTLRNYRELLRGVFLEQGFGPFVVISSPNKKAYVARVSSADIVEKLERFGRRFI